MAGNEEADVREKVDALLGKARSDDTFALSLKNDPEAVLTAAGFEGEALERLVTEIGGADVEGFRRCDRYTCIISMCGNWEIGNATN